MDPIFAMKRQKKKVLLDDTCGSRSRAEPLWDCLVIRLGHAMCVSFHFALPPLYYALRLMFDMSQYFCGVGRMETEARVMAEAEEERQKAREKEVARRTSDKQKRLEASDKEASDVSTLNDPYLYITLAYA